MVHDLFELIIPIALVEQEYHFKKKIEFYLQIKENSLWLPNTSLR